MILSKNVDTQYLELVTRILEEGVMREDASRDVTRLCIYGHRISLDVSKTFPLLQLKDTSFYNIACELFLFLRGDTNVKYLIDRNVNIWNKDAYQYYKSKTPEISPMDIKDFVKSIKDLKYPLKVTEDYSLGDLGPIYGKSWRAFGSDVRTSPGKTREVDQIANLIYKIMNDPNSTSMVVTAWNPLWLGSVCLPACHNQFQVNVRFNEKGEKILDLIWDQRSVDVALGLPYNIASYALLMHILCIATGCKMGVLEGHLKNCHIYQPHIESMKALLDLPVRPNNTRLVLNNTADINNINACRKYVSEAKAPVSTLVDCITNAISPESFNIEDYLPEKNIKLTMYEKTK